MTDLNYNIDFNRADLIRDIAAGLEKLLNDKSIEDRYKIVDRAADALFELGNYALYHGLVNYGVKIAIEKFTAHDEDAY